MQLHKVQCPACGGPLEVSEGQSPLIRCSFCGVTVLWDHEGQIDSQARLELAQVFVQAGDLAAAEQHLARALEAQPRLAEVWALKAQIAVLRGDFAAAETYMQKAALDPLRIAQQLAGLLPPARAQMTLLQSAAQTEVHWIWAEVLLQTAFHLDDSEANCAAVGGGKAWRALLLARESLLRLDLGQAVDALTQVLGKTTEMRALRGASQLPSPGKQGIVGLAYRAALREDFSRALKYLTWALKLHPPTPDRSELGDTLVLALIAGLWEQWDIVRAGIERAERYAGEAGAPVGATCLQLAIIARDRFAYALAKQFLETAQRLDARLTERVIGDPRQGYIGLGLRIGQVGAPGAWQNLEQAHMRLEQAMVYLERALELDRRARKRVAFAYLKLAREARWAGETELCNQFLWRAARLHLPYAWRALRQSF